MDLHPAEHDGEHEDGRAVRRHEVSAARGPQRQACLDGEAENHHEGDSGEAVVECQRDRDRGEAGRADRQARADEPGMMVGAPRVGPGNGMHEGVNLPSERSQTTPLTHDHNPGHGPFGPVSQSASIPAEPSQCGLK